MLFGAVEALQKQRGYLLELLLQGEYTEAVARVRAQLDPALLETAWAEGQAMTEEEAITSTLGYLQAEFDVVG